MVSVRFLLVEQGRLALSSNQDSHGEELDSLNASQPHTKSKNDIEPKTLCDRSRLHSSLPRILSSPEW